MDLEHGGPAFSIKIRGVKEFGQVGSIKTPGLSFEGRSGIFRVLHVQS